jgi:predicted flap endonuclease-1-like 5' DNA nuclease
MSNKKSLEAMDKLVLAGKFIDAVEQFFADHGRASSPNDSFITNTKEEKKHSLTHFLSHVKSTEGIKLHKQTLEGDTTDSLFSFHFTHIHDHPMVWHEIIRRIWIDGKVTSEEYIMVDEPIEANKTAPAVKAKPTTTKKQTATKVDDLKLIEGIGPKIEGLLHAEGIKTFAALVDTKVEVLKAILDAAGPRYRIHNPSTWAEQAKLADAGDWAKLQKWQDELKGGIAK